MLEQDTWDMHLEPPLVFFPPQLAKGKLGPSAGALAQNVEDLNLNGLLMPPLETAEEIGELLNLMMAGRKKEKGFSDSKLCDILPARVSLDAADAKVPAERADSAADAVPDSPSKTENHRRTLMSYRIKVEEEASGESPEYVEEKATRGCLCWKKQENRVRLVDKMNARLEPLRLDDEDEYLLTMAAMREPDTSFVLAFLILALIIDGRVGKRDWEILAKACAACQPPRSPSWSALQAINQSFVAGDEIGIAQLMDVMDGADNREYGWNRFMVSASLKMRRCLNCLNIF